MILYGFLYETDYVGTEFYGKCKLDIVIHITRFIYMGADKSLALPGRKQATSMSKSS